MKNLDAFEPLINEEVESPVNLKLAQKQLENTRVRSLPVNVSCAGTYYWYSVLYCMLISLSLDFQNTPPW